LIGLDLGHHQVRTFRVDRIEGAVKVGTPGAFARPTDFDPRTVFPADPKLLGDEVEARAEVLVDAPRADAVMRELGQEAVLRRVGDAVVVSVPCANRDAFRSWLFGLGAHAEILTPVTLRAEVIAWLEAMVAR
jgi:predicted DNA-binding transcriptional regulator YafY